MNTEADPIRFIQRESDNHVHDVLWTFDDGEDTEIIIARYHRQHHGSWRCKFLVDPFGSFVESSERKLRREIRAVADRSVDLD